MRLLSLFALILAVVVPVTSRSDDPPRAVTVMTYNLNYGNPRPVTSLDAIAAANADVVLLQEITSEWRSALQQRFSKQYPHQAYRVDRRAAGGLAVLSKHAISAEELWPAPAGTGAWFPAQRIVVASPLGALQILNVHLRPALANGSWVKGFLTTPPVRRKEIEAHWKRIDGRLPTIVAGDFNEDPYGLAVGFLAQHGMVRVPTAGPTTWHYETVSNGQASDLLKMDIDHVLIDGQLEASNAHVVDAGTSDHRPVVVTLAIKPPPPPSR